jgi:cytochrome c peroxidase
VLPSASLHTHAAAQYRYFYEISVGTVHLTLAMKTNLSSCNSFFLGFLFLALAAPAFAADLTPAADLNNQLRSALARYRFTGRMETTLETRLGRPINAAKVELGRALFFDKFVGLHGDNSCAGCHSPMNGFGDSQSIAIGVENNGFVGPRRTGPRNQRRTPSVVNTAFYPALMWNGRFNSISGDPFDNSQGFEFPPPEGTTRFPAGDSDFRHLLQAQAHIPPTELSEAAGFTKVSEGTLTIPRFQTKSIGGARLVKEPGTAQVKAEFNFSVQTVAKMFSRQTARTPDGPPFIDFDQFDVPAIGPTGVPLPPPQHVPRPDGGFDAFRNEPIRDVVLGRLNASEAYRHLFLGAFPELHADQPITFAMVGQAVAEFEFAFTFMNTPIDRFARGETEAMTPPQKQGALLFFGKAGCVQCHAVSGQSNELFTDFRMHVAGIPQIAPKFGRGTGNVPFRNAKGQLAMDGNQDFGLFDITEEDGDTYKFRTSPLRNLAVQAAFFHNGSFTRLSEALRYHLRTLELAQSYDPAAAGIARDLRRNIGPIAPVLQRLDPALSQPVSLSETEFANLLAFLRDGLLDERALPQNLVHSIPESVPSGLSLHVFETTPSGP